MGPFFRSGLPRGASTSSEASGLEFEEACERSQPIIIEGIEVRIPSTDDLIPSKRATGRTKELADAEVLAALKSSAN